VWVELCGSVGEEEENEGREMSVEKEKHPLFLTDEKAIQIIAYYDEVELCNQPSWL